MAMRTGSLALVVLVLGIGVGLAATNPTSNDYYGFVEGQLAGAVERLDAAAPSGDLVRQVFKSQGAMVVQSIVRPNTTRRNYGLFSIFTTKLLDVEVVVVGAGTVFVPIDGLDDVAKKISHLGSPPGR
ncbi:MAG: DUF4359 domain-containing protein [Nitrospira sp.]|nr:DUF4359 domain-containing protein [Nitrospira sp.]